MSLSDIVINNLSTRPEERRKFTLCPHGSPLMDLLLSGSDAAGYEFYPKPIPSTLKPQLDESPGKFFSVNIKAL